MAQITHSTPHWSDILTEVKTLRKDSISSGGFVTDDCVARYGGRVRDKVEKFATQLTMNQPVDKTCIRDTRLALRVALTLQSNPDELLRRRTQDMTQDWLPALLSVLDAREGDPKVRQLAAQVLCNSITAHSANSHHLVAQVSFEPSPKAVANRLLDDASSSLNRRENPYNWVDLLLLAASSRPALGAVVATLHNVMVQQSEEWLERLVSSPLLVCTLLRHVVGVQSTKAAQESGPSAIESDDPATEWILIVLTFLCRRGYLSAIYKSIGATVSGDCAAPLVVPEQVVLLHCVRDAVKEPEHAVFGPDDEKACQTALLLADEVARLQGMQTRDVDFQVLAAAALPLLLEILAEFLSADTLLTAQVRQYLASRSNLLVTVANVLATVVDEVTKENEGKLSRHMHLSEDQKRLLNVNVRLTGNLCFRNSAHQNMLRETLVPTPTAPERTALHVLLNSTGVQHACFSLREWAVLAVRYALEGCPANQEMVEKLQAISPVHSAELQKMGVKVELRGDKVSVEPMSDDRNSRSP